MFSSWWDENITSSIDCKICADGYKSQIAILKLHPIEILDAIGRSIEGFFDYSSGVQFAPDFDIDDLPE